MESLEFVEPHLRIKSHLLYNYTCMESGPRLNTRVVFHFSFLLTPNYLFCNLTFFRIDGHQLCVLCVLISVGTPHTIYHHLQKHNAKQASAHTHFFSVSFHNAKKQISEVHFIYFEMEFSE